MAVRLNNKNLYELKTKMNTETAKYIYEIESWGIGDYRVLRRSKKEIYSRGRFEFVKMPKIYRGYFGKEWKWYD